MAKRPMCLLCFLIVLSLGALELMGIPLIRGNPLPLNVQEQIEAHPGSMICGEVEQYENTEFSQSVYLKKTYLIYHSKKFPINNVRVFLKKEEELKKQQLQMDIYNAILRHKEALQEEEAWELSVRQAQENYRIMQNRYMNQLAILTDLLDANSVLLNAELQLTSSRTRIIYTYYQLQKACGRL